MTHGAILPHALKSYHQESMRLRTRDASPETIGEIPSFQDHDPSEPSGSSSPVALPAERVTLSEELEEEPEEGEEASVRQPENEPATRACPSGLWPTYGWEHPENPGRAYRSFAITL